MSEPEISKQFVVQRNLGIAPLQPSWYLTLGPVQHLHAGSRQQLINRNQKGNKQRKDWITIRYYWKWGMKETETQRETDRRTERQRSRSSLARWVIGVLLIFISPSSLKILPTCEWYSQKLLANIRGQIRNTIIAAFQMASFCSDGETDFWWQRNRKKKDFHREKENDPSVGYTLFLCIVS